MRGLLIGLAVAAVVVAGLHTGSFDEYGRQQAYQEMAELTAYAQSLGYDRALELSEEQLERFHAR